MKTPLIILSTAVVLIAGVSLYAFSQRTTPTSNSKAPTESNMTSNSATTTENTNSRYVEYSKEVMDNTASDRRVLFFYANWCPICKPADASFRQNSGKIPEDVTVIRVNYNDSDTDQEEKDLAKVYAITYQHTFVQIDKDGKELAKWNGGEIDQLLANIK